MTDIAADIAHMIDPVDEAEQHWTLSKQQKERVFLLLLLVATLIGFDAAVLIHARTGMQKDYSALHSKIEGDKDRVMTSIECLPAVDITDSVAMGRLCVLDRLRHLQPPSAMLTLSLIAQDMLDVAPDDLHLRIKTSYAISRTVHAYRNMATPYQATVQRARNVCNLSLLGLVVGCREWFNQGDPTRIRGLLKIRYEITRDYVRKSDALHHYVNE